MKDNSTVGRFVCHRQHLPLSQSHTDNINIHSTLQHHQHSCRSAHLQHTVAFPEGSTARMKLWPRDLGLQTPARVRPSTNNTESPAQQRCLISLPFHKELLSNLLDYKTGSSPLLFCHNAAMQRHSQWPAIRRAGVAQRTVAHNFRLGLERTDCWRCCAPL